MARVTLRNLSIVTLCAVAAIGVAYILGTETGNLVNEKRAENYKLARRMRTRQILDQMNSINIGDTLPNYGFDDVDGNWHNLSDLLSDKTVMMFLDPGCVACISELDEMMSVVNDTSDAHYFLLISNTSPDILRDFRDEVGIPCRILYDEDNTFESDFNIHTFPFNIMIDRSRVIVDIVATWLTADDITEVVAFNKKI